MNGVHWSEIWGYNCCCYVCKPVPKSALPTQASQTRLGESCRDSVSSSAHASRLGGMIWSWATDRLA